jgi:hypothetical protein
MLSYTELAVSAEEVDTYTFDRGLEWPADALAADAALRRGQDAIAREYNGRWATTWTNSTAPEAVKFAIIEAAVAEANEPGIFSKVLRASDAKVLTRVGELGWTPTGAPSGVEAIRPRLLHVEALLRDLVKGGQKRLTRA